MIVRLTILSLIIWRGLGLPQARSQTIKESRLSEYKYYERVKEAFVREIKTLGVQVRECVGQNIKEHIEVPEGALRVDCAGRFSQILHFVYSKNMQRLKRAFFALVVKNLEPFRVKYEDEIVYFLYVLDFITQRDLKLVESLESTVRTSKYQVHFRRYDNLMEILKDLLDDFQEVQEDLIMERTEVLDYIDKQVKSRDKYVEELEARREELEDEVDIDSHDIGE